MATSVAPLSEETHLAHYLMYSHYSDIIVSAMAAQTPVSQLFTQQQNANVNETTHIEL